MDNLTVGDVLFWDEKILKLIIKNIYRYASIFSKKEKKPPETIPYN